MGMTVEQLEVEIVGLPDQDRERLAISLLGSLPVGDDEWELNGSDFDAEMERRSEDIRLGRVKTLSHTEVRQRIQAILREP